MEVVDIMKNPERYAQVAASILSLHLSLHPPPPTLSASGPVSRHRQTDTSRHMRTRVLPPAPHPLLLTPCTRQYTVRSLSYIQLTF